MAERRKNRVRNEIERDNDTIAAERNEAASALAASADRRRPVDPASPVMRDIDAKNQIQQTQTRPQKSIWTAYLYYLLGGWWGLHHFYLERDDHAFLYCTTMGGFFFGWVRDLWRLPSYVDHYNRSYIYAENVRIRWRLNSQTPPRHMTSMFAQLLFGLFFGELSSQLFNLWAPVPPPPFPVLGTGGIPAWFVQIRELGSFLRLVSVICRAVGVAFGVWFVGNTSRLQYAPFRPIVVATLVSQLLASLQLSSSSPYILLGLTEGDDDWSQLSKNDVSWLSIVMSIFTYSWMRVWSTEAIDILNNDTIRRENEKEWIESSEGPLSSKKRHGRCFRLIRFHTAMSIFMIVLSIWTVHLTVEDVPLKVSLMKFVKSPEVAQIFELSKVQWRQFQQFGFQTWWQGLKKQFDLGGHEASYETLGLDPTKASEYTLTQLRRVRNKLALKYHPDKVDTEGLLSQEERAEKFSQIQRAYEKILKVREVEEQEKEKREQRKTHTTTQTTQTTTSTPTPRTSQSNQRTQPTQQSQREQQQQKQQQQQPKQPQRQQQQEQPKPKATTHNPSADRERARAAEQRDRERKRELHERQERERIERHERIERQKKQQAEEAAAIAAAEKQAAEKRAAEKKAAAAAAAENASQQAKRHEPSSLDGTPKTNKPIVLDRTKLTMEQRIEQARAAGTAAGKRYREKVKEQTGIDLKQEVPIKRK